MVLGEFALRSLRHLWHRPKADATREIPVYLGPWLAALAIGIASNVPLDAQAVSEYQIKAVFLFNFAQFVDWPAGAFPGPTTPIVIGVVGEDPFGALLDRTVQGERINNRPIAARRFRRVEEVDLCHVLFISRSETARLDQVLARLQNRPILTVGEVDGFAFRGGMIGFVTENNKVRMRINADSAKAAGLVISSKLLRPATIVSAGRD